MHRIALAAISLGLFATLVFAPAVDAKRIHVHKGDSIQKGVKRAKPGDKVVVHSGTYTERSRPCRPEPEATCAVNVTRDDIKLVAASGKVKLKAKGDQDDGIGIGKDREPGLHERQVQAHPRLAGEGVQS